MTDQLVILSWLAFLVIWWLTRLAARRQRFIKPAIDAVRPLTGAAKEGLVAFHGGKYGVRYSARILRLSKTTVDVRVTAEFQRGGKPGGKESYLVILDAARMDVLKVDEQIA